MEVIFQYANNIYYFKMYIKSINSNNLYTINICTGKSVEKRIYFWENTFKDGKSKREPPMSFFRT